MRSRDFEKPDRQICLIAHNIRSVNNVGSILRTADCLGVLKVYATGYTANISTRTDGSNLPLLPHVKDKLLKQLHSVSLGAEKTIDFQYHDNIYQLIDQLKNDGYLIIGLEQTEQSINLTDYQPADKIAVLLGEEVKGITSQLIDCCDKLIELAMYGNKESYNVSVATGIVLYYLATYHC